jgi:effector-binding domain-containing protein
MMMDEPQVEVRAAQKYIAIPIEANLNEWKKVNTLIKEVFEWLDQKSLQPNGAPFFRYWIIGDKYEKFKLEVGVPIRRSVEGDERVIVNTIPAGKYAVLVHTGHPDRIHNSLKLLEEWAVKRGFEWAKDMEDNKEIWSGRFEFYLTDPAVEPNLENWSTEILYLIK